MLVSTTSEIIKKLQEYEAKYGVGAIISIGTYIAGDRTDNYCFSIANDSYYNNVLNNEDGHYHREIIKRSAIDDDIIFPRKWGMNYGKL